MLTALAITVICVGVMLAILGTIAILGANDAVRRANQYGDYWKARHDAIALPADVYGTGTPIHDELANARFRRQLADGRQG